MKVRNIQSGINFGRSLQNEEIKEFTSVRDEAKKLAGQTGRSILIVHDACLPQSPEKNTGVGNLTSEESMKFFDMMKTYLGINEVKVLPQNQTYGVKGTYIAYGGDSTALGNHVINTYLLTTPEYAAILKKDEFDSVVRYNSGSLNDKLVNYENVVDSNSPNERALKKAHERFKRLTEENPVKLRYKKYVAENKERLEDKALYDYLAELHNDRNYEKWPDELDRNLYNPDFNPPGKAERLQKLKNESKEFADFHKFKQFLADEHLQKARKMLNKKGLKLVGDCPLKFSPDLIWRHPKAFNRNYFMGSVSWQFIAPDFEKLTDPNSEISKVLKEKVQFFAKRYDTLRFDASWNYVQPKLISRDGRHVMKPEFGGKILDLIDNYVKEVKGNDFDTGLLSHEFEADPSDFALFKDNKLRECVEKRTKVLGTTYMHEGWGSNHAFTKELKWNPDRFIIGVGNHDPQPLRQIANCAADNVKRNGKTVAEFHKFEQIQPLSDILHIKKGILKEPVQFAKAKFAEIMSAKNNYFFYMDVFGRSERFDQQTFSTNVAYRYKIPANFQQAYMAAVNEGFGLNIMDALEKVFVAKGLNEANPELYSKIVKYKNILNEKEPAQDAAANLKGKGKPITAGNTKTKAAFVFAGILVGIAAVIKFFPKKDKN